jgi:predicted  nucleic acid-binding Zn-ribbon protein
MVANAEQVPEKWEVIRDLKLKLTGKREQAAKLDPEIQQAKRELGRAELLVRNLERRRQEHVDEATRLLSEIARVENG